MQVQTMVFTDIQAAVAKHFKGMSEKRLFSTRVDKTKLWEHYLSSFPPGSNPLYKARTEHDCSCCRHFIKTLGGVVNILNGKFVTLWDFDIKGPYQEVADAMAVYVRGLPIDNIFLHPQNLVGTAKNRQLLEDSSVKMWDHFYVNLPATGIMDKAQIGTALGKARTKHDVMKRGLLELSSDAIDTVLELIDQNSLYRGEEHKFTVQEFCKLQLTFKKIKDKERQDLFVWENMVDVHDAVASIRGSAIGTLLVDLSEHKEMQDAVDAYERKVAPENYKRPTALVTKAMVAKAQQTINELGLTTALERRYAKLDDLTVGNFLFANRDTKKALNVFDEIAAGTTVDVKKLGKVEDIPIADFIERVLPKAQTVEALFENQHTGNMVSLVAPVDPTAKRLFKWPNGFSWSYVGDVADSIKERVKAAGGDVTGDFRASLSWFNYDDLDLHLKGPNGLYIWFGDKGHMPSRGKLDVDMNASGSLSLTPVENITFPKREWMLEGEYQLFVNQYNQRDTKNGGFEVEMEFDGVIHSFAWPNAVKVRQNVAVCKFRYSRKDGLTITESLASKQTSKTVWGLSTQTFHKVRAVMLSPNQWDGREIGNRHWFFMLDGCIHDGPARGFYNEFLDESLSPHRKVLEMVGARMKTENADNQLSGIGFSSTKRGQLLCRVAGSFTRTVKVLF